MSTRTVAFNTVATLGVWAICLSVVIFQRHIKSAFAPIYNAYEGAWPFYLIQIAILCAMAEPSPFVVLFACYVTLTPPTEALAWFVSSVPKHLHQIVLLTSIFAILYWSNGLLCMALERYFAKYLTKYRIQELRPHSRPMGYRKLIGFLALNTCFVPFVISLMRLFVDLDTVSTEPLGPLETCISLGFSIIANEVTFFYGHWLMHANKWFYANIHKIHHEFKAPCALAAVYCHPLELILSDFLPLGIGMLCFNTNLYFMAVFTAIAVLGTQTHHCGYKWPWIASHGNQPDYHDYHHEKFTCNYGNVGFLDLLHGTYQKPKNLLTSRREEKQDSSNVDPKTLPENDSKQSEDIDKNEILTKLPSKSRASSPGVRALREKTA